jgi:very-short-patch-repair endonuclease
MDDRIIEKIGAPRHGIVAWKRLEVAGVAPSTVHNWVEKGRLIRLYTGVYRAAGAPATHLSELMAATEATGGRASHRAAAWQWGLSDDQTIEVAVASSKHPRLDVVTHRITDLHVVRSVLRNGIPTMNPLQMLVHLGAVCDCDTVQAVWDQAIVDDLVTAVGIERMYDKLKAPGRNGCGVLRKVIDDKAIEDGEPDSTLELRMSRLMRRAGLPEASFQHWISGTIRVDFAYPHLKLAIEVDGRKSRGTSSGFQRHTDRQNELVFGAGWRVLRFTWGDVVRRPGKVASAIAAAIASLDTA